MEQIASRNRLSGNDPGIYRVLNGSHVFPRLLLCSQRGTQNLVFIPVTPRG
jgi:hypothetical protein